MRFAFPSAFANRAALSSAATRDDDPASTFGLCTTPPEVDDPAEAWSLRFFAYSVNTRAARAAFTHGSRRFVTSHAPRILPTRRSATCLRTIARSGRTYLVLRSDNTPGIWVSFAVFLDQRVWAFTRKATCHSCLRLFRVRPPVIPTCHYEWFRPRLFLRVSSVMSGLLPKSLIEAERRAEPNHSASGF